MIITKFNSFTPPVSRDTSRIQPIDKLIDEPARNDRWQDEYERWREAQQAFKKPTNSLSEVGNRRR